MADVTLSQWAIAFRSLCEFPSSGDTQRFFVTWAVNESSKADWNPLDTTEPWAGATDLPGNPDGVKCYPSFEVGLQATKTTLFNGLYNPLIEALRLLKTADDLVAVHNTIIVEDKTPWGPINPAVLSTVVDNQNEYYSRLVYGSPSTIGKPSTPTPSTPPTVQYGDTGATVKLLQEDLTKAGYNTQVDGIFGPATRDEVQKFQANHRLTVDGIVGVHTWAAILAAQPK